MKRVSVGEHNKCMLLRVCGGDHYVVYSVQYVVYMMFAGFPLPWLHLTALNMSAQISAPCNSINCAAIMSKQHLLSLGSQLFAIILFSAAITVVALSTDLFNYFHKISFISIIRPRYLVMFLVSITFVPTYIASIMEILFATSCNVTERWVIGNCAKLQIYWN